MGMFVSYLLVAMAVLLAIPAVLFLIEVIVALVLSDRPQAISANRDIKQRVAVLVPAHNESKGILSTLDDIKSQLQTNDRLLVVADNCTDDTVAVAAGAGAEIIERIEPMKRGKGYALDFGIKHLRLNPPTTVIVIDADCRIARGTIDQLAITCAANGRPLQALYLMTAPESSPISSRVAEFAWRIKNWVRPLGLNDLNLPCQLMGTGMAFPWQIIQSASLASGSIVEDLMLGLELAKSRSAPMFCPFARVTSEFPSSVGGAVSQRRRWEGGHINLIFAKAHHYIYEAVVHRNLPLFALALDMAIPPISLLMMLLAGMSLIAGIAVLFGFSSAALAISTTCIAALVLATFLSWLKYGRDILPPSAIIPVASYVLAKFPMYRRLLSSETPQWTRTDREKNG